MRRAERWLFVVVGLAVLLSLPAVVSAFPVRASSISAAQLRRLIVASDARSFSGYAESSGGLALPVTTQFTSLADLFGGRSQFRVWWRGRSDWRVDQLNLAGETDLHGDLTGLWTWNYEQNQAVRTRTPADVTVRLPVGPDLLPSDLGRRLLSEAADGEVSRLNTERIAGRMAPGLRLRPSGSASTIDHVDIWADDATGVALKVSMFESGSGIPALTSAFLDFSTDRPSATTTRFFLPARAKVRVDSQLDLATAINEFADQTPPATLAGVPRNPQLAGEGSIGVYGHGVTEFAAAPLFGRTANSLRDQLRKAPGVTDDAGGLRIAVGPLTLLLTERLGGRRAWLLVGTVTAGTLTTAASDLARSVEAGG
jgi:hypothetical protein